MTSFVYVHILIFLILSYPLITISLPLIFHPSQQALNDATMNIDM